MWFFSVVDLHISFPLDRLGRRAPNPAAVLRQHQAHNNVYFFLIFQFHSTFLMPPLAKLSWLSQQTSTAALMTWLLWLFLCRQTSGCQNKVRDFKYSWFFLIDMQSVTFVIQLDDSPFLNSFTWTSEMRKVKPHKRRWFCHLNAQTGFLYAFLLCFSLLVSIEQC